MSGEEWKLQIPVGFRFAPTDLELVQHYLYRKVNGEFIAPGILHEVDVYEHEPSHLPGTKTGEAEFTYYFTKREPKYPNGSKAARSTRDGKGYWKMTSKPTNIYIHNPTALHLGTKNTLVYYVKTSDGLRHQKTNWIMHEFVLENRFFPSTSSTPPQEKQFNDFVACRVYGRKPEEGETNGPQGSIKPKPVMTRNSGVPPRPSRKQKIESNMGTSTTSDHTKLSRKTKKLYQQEQLQLIHQEATHNTPTPHAIAVNPNYLNGSHDFEAAATLASMTTNNFSQTLNTPSSSSSSPHQGVPPDQASAIAYQKHMSPQIVKEDQNLSGLIHEVKTAENEGPHNIMIRSNEQPNNIPLGIEHSTGDLWDIFNIMPPEEFDFTGIFIDCEEIDKKHNAP